MTRTLLRSCIAVAALLFAPRLQQAQVSAGALPDSMKVALRGFGLSTDGVDINGRYVRGNATVPATDTVKGPLVVMSGTAEVFGVVQGNVYALWGDVIVHSGAEVYGSASAYHGRVILDGGVVRGALAAWPTGLAVAPTASVPMTRLRALQLSAGWTAMLLAVGILVLVLLSSNLETTARTLEQDFGKSFFVGVAGQLGFLPLLLVVCAALTVTVVGVLLVPFALVAGPVAFAGFVTLGWLALALVTGRAILRARAAGSSRADALRAVAIGVILLMVPWAIVAAISGGGTVAALVRVTAVAITWVAATSGLGAAILSRAGTGRRKPEVASPAQLQGWQTPTPVAGVAAARRPIPARPGATPK